MPPPFAISPHPQGQSVLSGSITRPLRGRWAGTRRGEITLRIGSSLDLDTNAKAPARAQPLNLKSIDRAQWSGWRPLRGNSRKESDTSIASAPAPRTK